MVVPLRFNVPSIPDQSASSASANSKSSQEPDWHRSLDVAASRGRLDMIDILIRKNAVSQKQGDTPYDGAIDPAEKNRHHAIAKMLRYRYEEQVKEAGSTTFHEQRTINIAEQELHWTGNTSSLRHNGPAEQDEGIPNFVTGTPASVAAETIIWDELEDPGPAGIGRYTA
jgi:hypothetical protein